MPRGVLHIRKVCPGLLAWNTRDGRIKRRRDPALGCATRSPIVESLFSFLFLGFSSLFKSLLDSIDSRSLFFSFVRLSRPPPRRKRVNSILIILVVVVGATPHAPHHKVTNPQNSWSQPSEHPNPESVTTPSNLLYARVVHFPTSHDRIRSRRVCLCTHSFQSQL
jgi:hypothetical protein